MGVLEEQVNAIAPTRQPVMILGEVGTGKEQIARALYLRSPLVNSPLAVVDCSLMTDKNWEYLFNHYASPLNEGGCTVISSIWNCCPINTSRNFWRWPPRPTSPPRPVGFGGLRRGSPCPSRCRCCSPAGLPEAAAAKPASSPHGAQFGFFRSSLQSWRNQPISF